MTIGDRIKKLRKDRDMTQEELAKCIDSKKQTIYKYENNIVTNIPSDKIEKIAEVLGTTPSYLMGWDDLKNILSHSKQEMNFINALKLLGCDIEYKEWLIPPKDFELDENKYYTITYGDISFNITVSEYEELVKDIKSYLRFKIFGLKEKRERESCKRKIPNCTLPNAAHEIDGASKEDKEHDEKIMDSKDF